jgi:spore maturation protein CgeB
LGRAKPTMQMKLLYVGQLWEGGTCYDRMRVLMELGADVIPFDTTPYFNQGVQLWRSLGSRFNWGPLVRKFNRDFRGFVADGTRPSHVWIDKGRWIYPETLADLRTRTGAKLIHYTPDAALLSNQSRFFSASIPLYHLLITTKTFEVELYKARGAKNLLLTHQAYDRARFFPQPSPDFRSDVTFIGHYEPHYGRCLRAVAETEAALKVWGPGWTSRRAPGWSKRYVQGAGVWRQDYARALSSADIALGLLSKFIPETSTTRTFEIPACGTFLLAERTEEHQSFFEEGKEAEYFSSNEELRDKIAYYTRNPTQRAHIAAAGHDRCLRSGYSNHDRLSHVLDRVREIS